MCNDNDICCYLSITQIDRNYILSPDKQESKCESASLHVMQLVDVCRSAKEAEEKIKKALDKGEVLPTEARFDSNCITPGTSGAHVHNPSCLKPKQ